MPSEIEQRLANAKGIVAAVLAGQMTPETDPWAFEEDTVYLSIRLIELYDPDWLLRIMAASEETGAAPEAIQHVLNSMGPLRQQAEALIGRAP